MKTERKKCNVRNNNKRFQIESKGGIKREKCQKRKKVRLGLFKNERKKKMSVKKERRKRKN